MYIIFVLFLDLLESAAGAKESVESTVSESLHSALFLLLCFVIYLN